MHNKRTMGQVFRQVTMYFGTNFSANLAVPAGLNLCWHALRPGVFRHVNYTPRKLPGFWTRNSTRQDLDRTSINVVLLFTQLPSLSGASRTYKVSGEISCTPPHAYGCGFPYAFAMRSSRSVPSSDASRIQSGILTPTSATSLNHDSNRDITSSRKRKRDSSALEELLKPTIVLKVGVMSPGDLVSSCLVLTCDPPQPHPPKILTKPVVLQPLMIIPRGYLPLSYLDLLSPTGDLTPSRFYESHVRILDLENRRGAGPHLLIARLDTNGSLFAIEGFEKSLYTACKLGSWVELNQLSSKATLACQQLLSLAQSQREATAPAAVALTTPSLHKANKEKRMAIEALQSVVRRKSRTQSVSTLPSLGDCANTPPITSTDAGEASPSDPTDTQKPASSQEPPPTSQPPQLPPSQSCALPPPPSGDELLEKIRTQYFDALYRSKVTPPLSFQ